MDFFFPPVKGQWISWMNRNCHQQKESIPIRCIIWPSSVVMGPAMINSWESIHLQDVCKLQCWPPLFLVNSQGKSSSTGNLLDKDDLPPPDYSMTARAFQAPNSSTFKQRPYSVAVPAFAQVRTLKWVRLAMKLDIQCGPIHVYLKENPSVLSGVYYQPRVHRMAHLVAPGSTAGNSFNV